MACSGASAAKSGTASLSEFKILLDQAKFQAGQVSIKVSNQGAIVHEFVIVKTDLAADKLPTAADGGVDEESSAITRITEAEDINTGTNSSLEASLQAGRYVVFCNLPGHYAGGMRAGFEVVPG
jgi:uncharacterized cupredoxin-like copper-binding protein